MFLSRFLKKMKEMNRRRELLNDVNKVRRILGAPPLKKLPVFPENDEESDNWVNVVVDTVFPGVSEEVRNSIIRKVNRGNNRISYICCRFSAGHPFYKDLIEREGKEKEEKLRRFLLS